MKRLLSLLIVAVMLLSLVVTTMASDAVVATHPFTDVASYGWATASLNKMYEKGIINGTSPTTFGPTLEFTREMMITTLWRMAGAEQNGADAESLTAIFTDGASVAGWAQQAVMWGYTTRVMEGYPEGDCRPQMPVTKQEAAAFIYKYVQYAGITLPNVSDIVLHDSPDPWAYDKVYACVRAGIITGDNGYFYPNSIALRIHAAQMLGKIPEKQREITYSTDPKDPNPTKIGTMSYSDVTFTEDVKISQAVVMTDGTTNNQFTVTGFGTHGWHESRVLRTKYGTYIVFVQDEMLQEYHPFPSGNGSYYIINGKFMLVKVTDTGFTKILEGTYPQHMGSCTPNVLAGEDGMIYVTAISDDKNTYWNSSYAREAAFLQVYEYNELTGETYTSGASVIDFKLPGKSGYGYYQPIVDTKNGKIYAIFAGGNSEGYISWFIYDIATHTWESTNRVVSVLDRSSYYHAYADGKGGIFFIAQSNPRAYSVAARYQAQGYNVKFKQADGYIFHALNLFHIPNMYSENIELKQSIFEPDYKNNIEFPVDSDGYKSPAGAGHYTQGNSYLDSNGYLYVVYFTSTPRSGKKYNYAVYNTNTSDFKKIKSGVLTLKDIPSTNDYEFIISENSDGDIYLFAINVTKSDAEMEIYKVDFNGTSASLKFNTIIKKTNGSKGSVKINYKGTSDGVKHSRLSFTSTRNGSIQDNIIGIVSFTGDADGKRSTTFSANPIYNTIDNEKDYAPIMGGATRQFYYYAIELPHN